jgi:IS30 family transposase
MKPYKQLASEQRYQIYGLKQAGLDQSQIAIYLGVNKSRISRELSRNKGQTRLAPETGAVVS